VRSVTTAGTYAAHGIAASERGWRRLAAVLALGMLAVVALLQLALSFDMWRFEDVDAYWDAALRLRAGLPLYDAGVEPDNYRVFRYAPWFAWVWVPLTYLPRGLVEAAWALALGMASGAVLVALVRRRHPAATALALILAPWFLSLVQVGNIQPLVVAALAFGVSRRSGPVWIGITASLKVVPIVYGLVYVARREWRRVAAAAVVAAVLVAPMLVIDRTGYAFDPGSSYSLWYYASPEVWLVGAVASGVVALGLAWRRSPYLWPALAVAAMLIAPRSHITYATFLAVGLLAGQDNRIAPRPDA
jgi:alpha-1,2-mannosyltransferase